MSKKIDHFFEISYAEKENSAGSMAIHFLSFIGMILGTSTSSLLCGFAFDLAAKTFTIDCDAVEKVDLQELLCCSYNQPHIYLLHEEI